jgi:hypothetical protein
VVVMKSSISLDITPCCSVKFNRPFEGTRSPFSCSKSKPKRSQHEPNRKQKLLQIGFLLGLLLDPEDGGGMFFQKIG